MSQINLQEWFEDRCRNKPSREADSVNRYSVHQIFMNEVAFPNGDWERRGKYYNNNSYPLLNVDPIFNRKPNNTDFQWWIYRDKREPIQLLGFEFKGGVGRRRRVRTVKADDNGMLDIQDLRDAVDELFQITLDLLQEKKEEREVKRERMILSTDLYQDSLKGLDPGCSIDTKVNGKCNVFLKNISDEQALEILAVASKWERTHDRRGRRLKK